MKSIYVKPLQGLGNRLLLLDSIYVFAERAEFDNIYICWESSNGFSNEKFQDLFDINKLPANITLITKRQYNKAKKDYFVLDNYIYQDPKTLEWSYNVPKSSSVQVVSDQQQLINTIIDQSFCYESYASLNWVFGLKAEQDNYFLRNYIKPNKRLKKVIDSVYVKDMNALHIRRGDAVSGPWADFYKLSKDECFHKKIKDNPNKKFFLSTDCDETEKNFLKLYPDQIIVNKNKEFVSNNITIDDQKGHQDHAVVDLFLLSMAKFIYGTNWSTFNEVANKIGQNNLDRLIHYNIPEFTAVVAVKNRFNILKVSIQSWLVQEKITEIIVVDWNSDDFDKNYLLNLDKRIKVITVEGEEYFHLSNSYNIGLKAATNNHILKLDADYILNPYLNLSDYVDIDFDREFLTGYWKHKEIDGDLGFLEHLNGFVCIKKEHLVNIGYYRGNKYGYGNDDCDLYQRLMDNKLVRKGLNFNKDFIPIMHIPHNDKKRVENYKEKDKDRSLQLNQIANNTRLS